MAMSADNMRWLSSLSDEEFVKARDRLIRLWNSQVTEYKENGKWDAFLELIDSEDRSRLAHLESMRIPFPL